MTGFLAFRDCDWPAVPSDDGPSPALSFSFKGDVFWNDRHLGRLPTGADPTVVAAGALIAVGREAAAAAETSAPGAVEVVGRGLIAAFVRRDLAAREDGGGDAPTAIVETTGDPAEIRAALERVAELGTVVLAGEPAGRTLDLDLYATVHRRGLVVAGVAAPLQGVDLAEPPSLKEEALAFCLRALADATPGVPAPDDALWHRVSSSLRTARREG